MSKDHSGGHRAAYALRLAATPTFAIMAAATAFLGPGGGDWICSAPHGGATLGGMVTMYLLMSAFHAPPWLKLMSGRRYPTGPGG
jgi:hypothetical protein